MFDDHYDATDRLRSSKLGHPLKPHEAWERLRNIRNHNIMNGNKKRADEAYRHGIEQAYEEGKGHIARYLEDNWP